MKHQNNKDTENICFIYYKYIFYLKLRKISVDTIIVMFNDKYYLEKFEDIKMIFRNCKSNKKYNEQKKKRYK
jgi:hypothetical protein